MESKTNRLTRNPKKKYFIQTTPTQSDELYHDRMPLLLLYVIYEKAFAFFAQFIICLYI